MFLKVIDINTRSAEAVIQIGKVYFYLNQFEASIEYLSKATNIDP